MSRATARAYLATALLTVLCCCSPQPKLRAAWYLGGSSDADDAATSTRADQSALQHEDMVVTVLNVGTTTTYVYEVRLNTPDGRELWPMDLAGNSKLESGDMMVLPSPPPPRSTTCGVQLVPVPVRLYVRTDPRQHRLQRIDIRNPIPSTLAEGWWPLPPSRCSGR